MKHFNKILVLVVLILVFAHSLFAIEAHEHTILLNGVIEGFTAIEVVDGVVNVRSNLPALTYKTAKVADITVVNIVAG